MRSKRKFLLISHRGNLNGPEKEKENMPNYILDAIKLGYDVEIDVWFHKKMFYLGHDGPVYKVKSEFLMNPRIWCHAKNLEALEELSKYSEIHYFWHQNDDATLTSRNYIWTYPGQKLIDNSICVLPEKISATYIKFAKCVGICSDYIARYK